MKSWSVIRRDATRFYKEWRLAYDEKSQAQSFLIEFFKVFGIETKQVATFEHRVKRLDGSQGFVDLLWKGCILIEMKSKGKDLKAAYQQARTYTETLPAHEIPRAIVVSDFQNFHLYDLTRGGELTQFKLADLRKYVKLFGFLMGLDEEPIHEQNPVNRKAAERMAALHDALYEIGYTGHALEVYLVRLLFCLFAEDSEIFEGDQFERFIRNHTAPDGSDLATKISGLFETLNTPHEQRLTILDPVLAAFPYVNGGLFREYLPMAAFSREMRESLLKCTQLDWSQISPAIFGAMFQGVMNPEERRSLGAHYTSEENILKLLRPLFLDALQEELDHAVALRGPARKRQLNALHEKLASLTFLDPACGCGNFLIITYRELRHLELQVLCALLEDDPSQVLDISLLLKVRVDQFSGIELEPFPAEISRVSLWLMDHLCNLEVSKEFGLHYARIPIHDTPHILCANALRVEWGEIFYGRDGAPQPSAAVSERPSLPGIDQTFSYIIGNPPFIGFTYTTAEQKADMAALFPKNKNLDFVTAWFKKASDLIQGTETRCAFVATNSICQGEQVAPLWSNLNITIDFAYRTFKWRNEARGVAAVHCVIVGFSSRRSIAGGGGIDRARAGARGSQGVVGGSKNRTIFDEEGNPIAAHNINAYLVDAPDVIVKSRSRPLSNVPPMIYGNKPTDGGNLIIEAKDYTAFIAQEPAAIKYIKRFVGAQEYINNQLRYCLWLVGASPAELSKMPLVIERVKAVREMRLASQKAATNKKAAIPTLFDEVRQPDTNYILVPRVSSERRAYVPMGFFDKDTIASDSCQIIPDATLYHFGVLESRMHMAWMRAVCGRLKSDYRYSKNIVYNNFIWPEADAAQEAVVSKAAQAILDARALYQESTLAELYDPLIMPPELVRAHNQLDKVVDRLYGRNFNSDSERVAHLFGLYGQY